MLEKLRHSEALAASKTLREAYSKKSKPSISLADLVADNAEVEESSPVESRLLDFARTFKDAGSRGIRGIEKKLSEWMSGLSAEDLVPVDARMLAKVCESAGLDRGKALAFQMSIDKAIPKDLLSEVWSLRGLRDRPGESDSPVFSIDNRAEGNKLAYDTAKGLVEATGIEVVEVSGEEAQEMLGNKKASLDTGKANHKGAEVPAISSDDVAKIQKNLKIRL